jgi:hypothetical protein
MATSDQEQKGVNVPQHKRMAMGEKRDGSSLKGSTPAKPTGGLSHVAKKKK